MGIKNLDKLTLQLWVAMLLILFGIILLTAAFLAPPIGIIDSSVLVAYGETLTFVGGLIGVDYNYKYKVMNRHHDMDD